MRLRKGERGRKEKENEREGRREKNKERKGIEKIKAL
jgi:hypothetical protein